jgi:two-component system chemotaxis sensor kinase CheA
MTIDMSQFYQVFFDETGEHLATMEALLLGIDVDAPNDDDLNAIFRAAHSIKGGSGTFGFTDMTEVTHELESLLDKARKHEIRLTTAMVDALLAAGDVLNAQLARHRGDADVAEPEVLEICARIKQFVRGADAPPVTVAAPAPAAMRTVAISFPLPAGEQPPVNLLAELGARGNIETREIAAGRCSMQMQTAVDDTALREIFAYFVDPVALVIAPANSVVPDPGYGLFADEAPEPAPATDPGYGFFGDSEAVPEVDPGYGFFAPLPEARSAPAPATAEISMGRRVSDRAEAERMRAGRRDTDKVVVPPQGETSSIRVSIEKVDSLINLVGELVITQAMLAQSASQVDPVIYEKLLNGMGQLERNTRGLQEAVMSIRMMPISFVFSRFPRVVRDLAAKLGKEVELKTTGESTELDKGLIEKIADPLTHLVRNSLDHGIESPAQRVAAGKPASGTITLRAFHQGGNIIIEVSDDGAGLNREKIVAKARERGMVVADTLSDQEVWPLIFEAGFSTAEVVTDVSGRGVGMDVVKRNIHALGGRVEIDSATGHGTRISVRLPLTLAILDGLSVAVGGELFIIPLTYIVESLQPAAKDVKTIGGRGRVVQVRGEYVPVVALHEVFNLRPQIAEVHQGIVVILETEGHKTALFVDALVGQHQVVIKSLESNYRRVHGVSGATIMGDGKVALILDAVALGCAAAPVVAEAA